MFLFKGFIVVKKSIFTRRYNIYLNKKKIGSKDVNYNYMSEDGLVNIANTILSLYADRDFIFKYYRLFIEEFLIKNRDSNSIKMHKNSVLDWINKIKNKISGLIDTIYLELGLNSKDLSNMLGVSAETIKLWQKNDKNIPNIATAALTLLIENFRYKKHIENIKVSIISTRKNK